MAPKAFHGLWNFHSLRKSMRKIFYDMQKLSRMGLELASKLEKMKLAILLLHEKLDENFSWALCDKLRSKSAAFYYKLWK